MAQKNCCSCMKLINESAVICPVCGFDISEYQPEPHQLAPGTMLNNRIVLGKVMGEGGFGITYVGKDTVLDLKVAVKEFYMSGYVNRNCTSSSTISVGTGSNSKTFEKNREKFLDEARVLAKFASEDGIVGIRDYFKENNTAYIVMDFLEGDTLKSYLKKRFIKTQRKISWNEIMEILDPVLHSLEQIHRQNIIHRDISPDNIMLLRNGKAKLLDFGAAREFSSYDEKSLSVILKPGYAPQEQYRSKGVQGPWTDIYAICATIYRCITGKVPDESMERMFEDNLVPPYKAGANCTPAQSAVLMKGLAVNHRDRYKSITEFLADVKRAEKDPDNADITNSSADSNGSGAVRTPENGSAVPAAKERVKEPIPQKSPSSSGSSGGQSENGRKNIALERKPGDAESPKRGQPVRVKEPIPLAGNGSAVEKQPADIMPPKRPEVSSDAQLAAEKSSAVPVSGTSGTAVASVRKPGKFLKLLKFIIPAFIVLIIALIIIISSAGKEKQLLRNGGQLPEELVPLSFEINGEQYSIPETFEHFEKNGWIPNDGSDLSEKVRNSGGTKYYTLTNGYSSIYVTCSNTSPNTLSARDCYITSAEFTKSQIDYSKDTFVFPNNAVIGETLESEWMFNDFYCDKKKDSTRTEIMYYESETGEQTDLLSEKNKSYDFVFYSDTLYSIEIKDFRKDLYDIKISDEPPAYDVDFMKKQGYGKWVYTQYGFAMPVISTLDDYLKSGWTVEEKPEYIASHDYTTVNLRYDPLTTMRLRLYNASDNAVYPENALVYSLSIESTDKKRPEDWTLRNGNTEIKEGMTLTEIKEILDGAGFIYETEKEGIYYTLWIYTDNKEYPVISITLDSSDMTAHKCEYDLYKLFTNPENYPPSDEVQ